MNILVVDDSEPIRKPICIQLQRFGHTVETAADGLEGEACYVRGCFDLVITDIRMPRMDGLELLSRIKHLNPEQDVIIITGYGDMDSSLEALRLGAANYLMKPVNMEELGHAVEAVEAKLQMAARLREQECRLAEAKKMASLGLVSAGVAHEINNPNTFIRGNVQTLQKFWERLDPFVRRALEAGVERPAQLDFILEETPHLLEAMLAGTDRITGIVGKLSAFRQMDSIEALRAADFNGVILLVLESFGPAAKVVRSQLDLTLPPVRADEHDLADIVRELVENSLEAVCEQPEAEIEIRTRESESGLVELSITDNGRGIRKEYHDKIFTPFFTTAPRIGRPGLGLSKVYALVKGLGGDVFFSSEEGKGATFTVRLPR